MKFILAAILPLLMLVSVFSCKPDDEKFTTDPKALLSFSPDTVFFDTVFVSKGSVTKRLKVYNRNKNAVKIEEIRLAGANQSPYKLIIDGVETPIANNIEIRGEDSLYILVKATIDPKTGDDKPFIVLDSIMFRTNQRDQKVILAAYGQNAHYFRGDVLACNTTWTNDKPYIIIDSVYVPQNCTFTIQEGVRIFMFNNAKILVDGTLKINGTKNKNVTIQGFRREEFYEQTPGQWLGIFFNTTSENNEIRYARIKNGFRGIWLVNPGKAATKISNTIIQNMFESGIMSWVSNLDVTNSVISNCGSYAVAGLGGGTYNFSYVTIANYSFAIRKTSSFTFTDYIPNQLLPGQGEPVNVNLVNSIVWGNFKDEILLDRQATQPAFNISAQNNIFRTEFYKTEFNVNNNKINTDPNFKNTALAVQNFKLDTLSPASNAGVPVSGISTDLEDTNRNTTNPNPAQNQLTIEATSDLQVSEVILTNAVGQQVKAAKAFNESVNMDLTELANGIYFVKVTGKDGSITQKISILK